MKMLALTVFTLLLGHGAVHAQPAPASLTVGLGDSAFLLTADTPGTGGNAITFEMASSSAASSPLSVFNIGNAIFVGLSTNASGIVTSTAAQVVSAINANPSTALLVNASVLGLGSGVEAPLRTTFLAGGSAGTVSPIPEPETYAMLLAGLGLLGFEARRRRKAQRAA